MLLSEYPAGFPENTDENRCAACGQIFARRAGTAQESFRSSGFFGAVRMKKMPTGMETLFRTLPAGRRNPVKWRDASHIRVHPPTRRRNPAEKTVKYKIPRLRSLLPAWGTALCNYFFSLTAIQISQE